MGTRNDYILILDICEVSPSERMWQFINLCTGVRGEQRTINWGVPEYLVTYFIHIA
jgi:hypothetical protein